MDHDFPPNETVTLTVVSQAKNNILIVNEVEANQRTIKIVSLIVACARSSIGNERVKASDLVRGTANERSAGINSRISIRSTSNGGRTALRSQC